MCPEVPTVIEAGFPSLVSSNWWAVAAPKGTPDQILQLLNQALIEALGSSAVAEQYAAVGVQVPTQTREQFIASLVQKPQAGRSQQISARMSAFRSKADSLCSL